MTGLTNITYQQMDSWSQAMIDGIANYGGDPDIETACRTATAAIDAAIDERLIDLRARPDDSLLSALTRSDMPEANVRANIKLTISGGQNEPRDAIAGSVWALLTHPDQLALVRSGTVSWLDAFEEYCRWISPIGLSPRRIAADHTYGGVRFETDDRVFLMFSSANHDETHFDEPERFDVGRDTTAALTFGAGPHFCAGAAAARSMVGDSALLGCSNASPISPSTPMPTLHDSAGGRSGPTESRCPNIRQHPPGTLGDMILGFDVGGTNARALLIDPASGEIRDRDRESSGGTGPVTPRDAPADDRSTATTQRL